MGKIMSYYKTEAFNKIFRTTDPETSRQAAIIAPVENLRQKVLTMIQEAGEVGITAKEMQRKCPELTGGSISSRPKELEKEGKVFYRGDKRDGARVIRSKYWKPKLMY